MPLNSRFTTGSEFQQQTFKNESHDYSRPNLTLPSQYPPGVWWKQWQIMQLFLCCLFGALIGVGHHFYYSYLNGREAENQAWIIRSGTATAFLAKLLFSTSIGTAFPQRVWQTIRSKALSIEAVDALFALRSEATSFFNTEMVAHAKLASLIALSVWSLALVPILVSGSISVKSDIHVRPATSIPVQNLNFSKPLSSVQFNGTTPLFTLPLVYTTGIGASPDAYVKPSSPASSFVSNTLYGKRMMDSQSPCGANCSFSQSFEGPAYKCEDVDFTKNMKGNPFCTKSTEGNGDCGGYFDLDLYPSPFSGNWYMARNSSGDACEGLGGDDFEQCAANAEPWWDGKLWVLYQYLLPQYRATNEMGTNSTPVPNEAWERHIFVCQSYDAAYTLRRTYRNFQQTIEGNMSYLNPVNYTGIVSGESSSSPQNYPAWAIHQTLYSLLNGSVGPNGRFVETDSTSLAMSALVQDLPFPLQSTSVYRSVMSQKPVQNLRAAIEQLHFNITVGLLSLTPQLLYSDSTIVQAETQDAKNVWSYNWHVLVATYAIAALIDVVTVIIGIQAMAKNGGCCALGFARVLATSRRNGALDEVFNPWEHGMDPAPSEVKKTRLIYRGTPGAGQTSGFVCL